VWKIAHFKGKIKAFSEKDPSTILVEVPLTEAAHI
jgi:hypothetical protein